MVPHWPQRAPEGVDERKYQGEGARTSSADGQDTHNIMMPTMGHGTG